MNSERWQNPIFVTLRSMSSPINSGAGKRKEAYCFTASTCLVRIREGSPKSVASAHQPLAKGDEATHPPSSWETKGSRKLLTPLKRTSVILSSRMVLQEIGITSATQEKRGCGVGLGVDPKKDIRGWTPNP